MTHPSTIRNNYFFFDASWPYPGKRNNEASQESSSYWRAGSPSEDYSSHFQEHKVEPPRKRARLISTQNESKKEDDPIPEPMDLETTNRSINEYGKSFSNDDDDDDECDSRPSELEHTERHLFNRLILQRISSRFDAPAVDYVDAKLQDLIRGSLRAAMVIQKEQYGAPSKMETPGTQNHQMCNSCSENDQDTITRSCLDEVTAEDALMEF